METETGFEINGTLTLSVEDNTDTGRKKYTLDRDALLYGTQDVPAAGVLISVALQEVISNMAGILFTSFLLSDVVCAEMDNPIRAKIFSTTLFMCGLCTILQSFFGIRLPIFQGPSRAFLIPLVVIRSTETWQCDFVNTTSVIPDFNSTQNATTHDEMKQLRFGITDRLTQLQGSLIAASLVETAIGGFGLVGFIIRFVGPIAVSSTIILIALSLLRFVVEPCMVHWPLAILSLVLVIVFSLYLSDIQVPVPIGIKKRKLVTTKLPVFKFLPVLLSVLIVWFLCWILTVTNSFTSDPNELAFRARSDAKDNVVTSTPWFYVPYPGQFGTPNFNIAVFLGFVVAVFSSTVESIGDYFAASCVCQVPTPPRHAINRGILVEGLGSAISGLVGSAYATTSYTGDVAIINLTKVASRYCMIGTGVICIILSIIGKVGAFITTIPDPVLGGQMLLGFGLMTTVGISTLKVVDLKSSRNLAILGISIYVGLAIPNYVDRFPESLKTGDATIDQILKIILGTPMFIGAFISTILDNTVKGTQKERGLENWAIDTKQSEESQQQQSESVYEFSWLHGIVAKYRFCRYLPFIQKPRKEVFVSNVNMTDDDISFIK